MNDTEPQDKRGIEKDDDASRSSRLEERRKLYPGLYKSDQEVQDAIEKYAVVDVADFRKRPRLDSSWQRLENMNGDTVVDELISGNEEANDNGTNATLQKPIYSNADIWGAIPAQEPKYCVECQICNRQVAVSRFAPHLDKCMGLGSVRGAVSNGASRGTNVNR
jgi:hypothetical protein